MNPTKSDSSKILVRDIMKKELIFVNPSTTAFQIANMMKEGGISAIFVKDGENFVGIVTDRDFAIKIAVDNLSFDTPVEKIMSSPIITIDQSAPISAAAKLMGEKKIRKLGISNDDKIVGILRSVDFVKYLEQ